MNLQDNDKKDDAKGHIDKASGHTQGNSEVKHLPRTSHRFRYMRTLLDSSKYMTLYVLFICPFRFFHIWMADLMRFNCNSTFSSAL